MTNDTTPPGPSPLPSNLCPETAKAFEKLVTIIAQLRNPVGGCPWDVEQTHASLRQYMIEEAYEVVEAIEHEPQKLSDELGDVLLQVVLHSQLASEAGTFTIADVIERISTKMVERHPHVFAQQKVADSKEVLKNWESRKKEKLAAGTSIVDGVPRGMPQLQRAQRIGEKVARVGFEWDTTEATRDKVLEELREFLAECCTQTPDEKQQAAREEEFGDLLFALSQLARRLEYNSEELLKRANDKFVRRFKEVERRAGPAIAELGLRELDRIWDQVKLEEKAGQ